MNEHAPLTMDKATFLRWAEGRQGRFELVGRRVMMMTGGTYWHARIKANVADALRRQLDPNAWAVLESDMAVDVGPDDIRYPDVVVVPADHPNTLSTDCPCIVVEVLSPSSATLDLGDKAADYLGLAALQAYLVFAQDAPKAWVYVREDGAFPPGPRPVADPDAVIAIPGLGITLRLADAYRGLTFGN